MDYFLEKMKRKNNLIDTETRLKNLRINGLPEGEPTDNLRKAIRELATTLQLDPGPILVDIDLIYCIGKPNPRNIDRPRPVVIKFQSYGERDKMMKAHRLLKGKNIYINDDLTRKMAKEFSEVSKMVADGILYAAWTSGGIIMIKKRENDEPVKYDDYIDEK